MLIEDRIYRLIKLLLSGEIIAYRRNYVLKSELKPEEEEIETFFREWIRKSRTDILNYVYKKYPEYTKYSVIRDKVLTFSVRTG